MNRKGHKRNITTQYVSSTSDVDEIKYVGVDFGFFGVQMFSVGDIVRSAMYPSHVYKIIRINLNGFDILPSGISYGAMVTIQAIDETMAQHRGPLWFLRLRHLGDEYPDPDEDDED